ncbi:MAG: ATP-binding cassette domain-containing protein [Bacteroidales bacterium]|nr:ATP-binding cassette domain-containing protein [Bacteroidales bacterium]
MKQFIKIVKLLKPYLGYCSLNVLFNVLSAVFALFSFTMVIPFLGILFESQPYVTEPVPFKLSAEGIEQNFGYYITLIIENYGKTNALLFVSILVIFITLFKNGFKYIANYFMAPIRTGVERDLRNNIYDKILRLPLSYYTEARKGDVISRISVDVKEIELSIMSSLEMLFRDPITIVLFLGSMFILSAHLTLFVLILLPISGLIIGRIGKNLRSTSFKGQEKMGAILSFFEETLTGLRIIKAFNAEEKVTQRFNSANNFYTRIMNKVHRRRYLAPPLSEFLGTAALMILMWYGGTLVLGDVTSLSPGTFIAFIVIFSQIITPAKGFSTAYFNIQKGLASAERVDQILDAPITVKEKQKPVPITGFNHSIEFRNVYFKYENDFVLENINLTIEKGKTVALVGKSGGGKSTLADLIPRFMDITSGQLLIDGIPLEDYRLYDLRNLMGIVSQQPILFNDSFFNNIAFGLNGANKEDVIAAAKVANAHNFILETANDYNTNVGDAGNKLSGGEKQRISIARAVLKNPPILILDEATSALDTESERLVQEAILNLMKNRTSIVIAHRLSTIKYADEICVIHEGKIVERGKHMELLKKKGYYYRLHNLQMF